MKLALCMTLIAVGFAKTNQSSLLRTKACGKECPGDDEGGMDLIKTEIPEKPSSDLGETFENLEAWNAYVDKVANPNPMAAASERAAMFVNKLKRKHDQQQRELASSNEELRLSTRGGLMTILSKFAARWEQEQRNQAEADKRKADLQAIRDERHRLEEREKFIRSFSETLNGKKSTKEQLSSIIENAQAAQGTEDNSKAFTWLKKAIDGYKAKSL